MKNKFTMLTAIFTLIFLCASFVNRAHSQTEGFNVKTPIQKISDSTSKFLNDIMQDAANEPKTSIPQGLFCSSPCVVVIPEIEILPSRGDYIGTGLMACRAPNSVEFTEPLFYQINNLGTFEETGGGLIILVTDTAGMRAALGNDVHLNSDNTAAGEIGASANATKSFIAYAKFKDEKLQGFDLSGSVLQYSSKDTFDAYQGTIVPIEIFINPMDVPPVLRDFDSLLGVWTKSCK